MRLLKYVQIIPIVTLSVFTVSCSNDDEDPAPTPTITVPDSYDTTGFTANTADTRLFLAGFEAVTTEAKKANSGTTDVDSTTLFSAFSAVKGGKSTSAITTSYYAGRLTDAGGYFSEAIRVSGANKTFTPGDTSASNVGMLGSYAFNQFGVEPYQLVQKGLFGAALYNEAKSLLSGTVTEAAVDQAVLLYGAEPAFVNSNNTTLHGDDADTYFATYAARRDNANDDGTGFYDEIHFNFRKLKAAVKASSDADRDLAISEIFRLWEKANAATAINYMFSAQTKMSASSVTDADKGSALHALSEALGFLEGWKTFAGKKITDDQIKEVLKAIRYPLDGTNASLYVYVNDPTTANLTELGDAAKKLQDIYGFTDQQMEDFKKNWVNETSR